MSFCVCCLTAGIKASRASNNARRSCPERMGARGARRRDRRDRDGPESSARCATPQPASLYGPTPGCVCGSRMSTICKMDARARAARPGKNRSARWSTYTPGDRNTGSSEYVVLPMPTGVGLRPRADKRVDLHHRRSSASSRSSRAFSSSSRVETNRPLNMGLHLDKESFDNRHVAAEDELHIEPDLRRVAVCGRDVGDRLAVLNHKAVRIAG